MAGFQVITEVLRMQPLNDTELQIIDGRFWVFTEVNGGPGPAGAP